MRLSNFGALLGLGLLGLVAACGATNKGLEAPEVEPKTAQQPDSPSSSADSLLLDALGQVYRWAADGTFEKLRSANALAGSDTLRYRYRNVRLGELQSVDLTNPLRPVLFYRDAQTVVWLHRNMTELRQVNLLDAGLAAVDAVAYAPSEGLWVYAADRQQLLQLDRAGEVRYESAELSQTFGRAMRAVELAASSKLVALTTEEGRLLLFGPFGGYRTELLEGGGHLTINGDRLLFTRAGAWQRYAGPTMPIEPVQFDAPARLLALRGEYALWQDDERWWVETVSERK